MDEFFYKGFHFVPFRRLSSFLSIFFLLFYVLYTGIVCACECLQKLYGNIYYILGSNDTVLHRIKNNK